MNRYTTKGKERKYTARVKTVKKKIIRTEDGQGFQIHVISNRKEENQSKKTDQ